MTAAREGVGDVLKRSMRLPELEMLREDHARSLQQAAVDSIERLQAGITFHVGTRAPILEALFGKVKFAVVRRADKEDFEKFGNDFEKRINSSYCKRMFSDPQFQFAQAVLEDMRVSLADWRGAFSGERLPAAQETALRDELESLSRRLDLPMRQARLLAEAALSPLRNAFEDSGLGHRPKRRNAKPVVTESDDGEVEAKEPAVLTAQSINDAIDAEESSAAAEAEAAHVAAVEAAPVAPVVKKPRRAKAAKVSSEHHPLYPGLTASTET